jgi:hypothetical protein
MRQHFRVGLRLVHLAAYSRPDWNTAHHLCIVSVCRGFRYLGHRALRRRRLVAVRLQLSHAETA